MTRFNGRVYLLSGGARGIGAAQARQLVGEGGMVVIADVLIDEGRKLASELGSACVFQPLDVTSEAQWSEAVAVAERMGTLHGLVNNAGVYAPFPLVETSLSEFERHVRINQTGTFLGMRSVVAAFERTLRLQPTAIDRYVGGDTNAFTQEQKLGAKAFFDVGCPQCHFAGLRHDPGGGRRWHNQ